MISTPNSEKAAAGTPLSTGWNPFENMGCKFLISTFWKAINRLKINIPTTTGKNIWLILTIGPNPPVTT